MVCMAHQANIVTFGCARGEVGKVSRWGEEGGGKTEGQWKSRDGTDNFTFSVCQECNNVHRTYMNVHVHTDKMHNFYTSTHFVYMCTWRR